MVGSTRLRFLGAKKPEVLSKAIESLPFKVEIKSIQFDNKNWFCFFVIPDEAREFESKII
jgi:hypothetical protein